MKFLLAFVICLWGGLGIVSVCGWGEIGHKIVAQIAADQLTETAQNIVTQFIGGKSLADIAPLPDDYDHSPQGAWSEPCHFCNLPENATHFYMSDCPHFCVVKSIKNYTAILSQTQSNPTPCDFTTGVEPCALEFLVHFVGDVHQPLHVGYGYDIGGNDVKVTFYGEATNLHKVWDDNMIWRWEGSNDWTWGAQQLEQLMENSNETAFIKQYLSDMNPIDWANESFQYVLDTCYNFTDSRGAHKRDHALSEVYYNRNLPIVFQRLIAAGVRLGKLLNSILTG
jgi:hypothetical protein